MIRTKLNIDIPKDWTWQRLEDTLDFVIGGDWGKDENFEDRDYGNAYCIRGAEIKNWDEEKGRTASLRKVKLSNIEKRKLIEGDILVEISGGGPEQPVGRTVLIDKSVLSFNPDVPKICTNFLRLIRPKDFVDSKFLNLYLKLFYYSGEIVNYQAGSNNLRNLKFPDYINVSIPLPPKPIQQAIVSKIEELFSELDKGIEQLKTAQQQLKTYRQSVLKWAFEGRLTNENVKDGELPEGWKVQKLNDIGTWKGGGTPSKANKTFWENGTILWVSPKDMKSKIIYDTIDKITLLAIGNSSAKLVDKGSILFVVRSGILRRILPAAITASDVTVNQDIQALTPKNVLPDYVYWYIQAKNEDIRRECSKDGTTVESIESSLLKNYPIPVCSTNEQTQIVQQIESRLSVADKMEESITQSLQQAEALRQSILKKAFEGKLVNTGITETNTSTAKVIPLERKILAGKIIHLLHDDKHFGLTKFQKILYVVENFAEAEYETNYLQERAGPYDKDFTLAFRKEMQEKDWVQEEQKRSLTKFIPGENMGSLIAGYATYFRPKGKQIVFAIQQLKDKTTHEAELIATLYAVWNNRLIKNKPIKIDLLEEDFFNWSAKKREEFQPEEIRATYKWMKTIAFVPKGFGQIIG